MADYLTTTKNKRVNPLEQVFDWSIDERWSQIICQNPHADPELINRQLCAELRQALLTAEVRLWELEGSHPCDPAYLESEEC